MDNAHNSCLPPALHCCVIFEHLNSLGVVQKTSTYKDMKISLARNEFRDMLIILESKNLQVKYQLLNVKIHKRFVKDGKATLNLKEQLLNIMISNAPPNTLLSLLKCVMTKLTLDSGKPKVSVKERLASLRPHSIEEISPLTLPDYNSYKQKKMQRTAAAYKENIPGNSPLTSKRKLVGKDGNLPPTKLARRTLSGVSLSNEQRCILSAVQGGNNLFFTGGAGTGKSFLLKKIVGILPPDVTFVTASTGIAASQIGGTTLHSFAGIGTGQGSTEHCIQMASRGVIGQQWRKCKSLIIDEISMVDGDFFKKLEVVARSVRKSDKPFGGIQLILCGDFLQLPPVSKGGNKKTFCFQTAAWDNSVHMNMRLCQVRRQTDNHFINILKKIRFGRCTEEDEVQLKATATNRVESDGIKATRLCTHRNDVDYINEAKLKELTGCAKEFHSIDSDPYLSKMLDVQTPVGQKLTLKVGAQVMLMKNLDVAKGLVNGARGVVTSFKSGTEGNPLVKFVCGITTEIKAEKWTIKGPGNSLLSRYQIPLKLAWAFSIHKSQGMTLDCVEMALSKVFEPGQAYVALSRAKSLECIRVLDFSQNCIRAHPDVLKFYDKLYISDQ